MRIVIEDLTLNARDVRALGGAITRALEAGMKTAGRYPFAVVDQADLLALTTTAMVFVSGVVLEPDDEPDDGPAADEPASTTADAARP